MKNEQDKSLEVASAQRLDRLPGRRCNITPDIRRNRTVFIVWLTGIATTVLFAGLAWYVAPLYPGVVMLELAFAPKAFGTIVHAWPSEYLLRYRQFLALDFLLLGAYGAFGYFLATRSSLFSQYFRTIRTVITWALPVAAALGAFENALHLWLTAAPRFGIPLAYAVSAACAASKWIILVSFALAVFHALLRQEREQVT